MERPLFARLEKSSSVRIVLFNKVEDTIYFADTLNASFTSGKYGSFCDDE